LPRRLPRQVDVREAIAVRHDDALHRGGATYTDPVSGLSVFTSEFLARRGYCCDSGCRHCPFAVEP